MNSKTGLVATAWVVTLGAAFFVGRASDSPGSDKEAEPEARPIARSSRGEAGGSSMAIQRNTPNRGNSDLPQEDRVDLVRQKVQELKAMSDPIARAQEFLDFVRLLEPDEFLAAVDAFREGGIESEQFGEYRLLLSAWAQVDPWKALDYSAKNTGTPFARQTILAAWVKTDTEGAIQWAQANFDNGGDENRANPWLVGVIEGLAPMDPARATKLLEDLPFSRERGEALDAVFSEILRDGNEAAKQWVSSLGDERLQAGAASRLASTLAKEDPLAAAEWAASMGPDIMAGAAGEIVDQWARRDFGAARDWVERQPQEVIAAAGPRLIDEMIEQEDIATASGWLQNYEGNPEFDNTVRSFVWNAIGQEPNVAADWIMKLTNEEDQTRTFHRVLRRWMDQDRQGAMNYINTNPVPESIRRRVGLAENQ